MKKQHVLITGGSRGIGFALAKLFIEKDYQVTICSRSAESLANAKAKLPSVATVQADLSTSQGRTQLVEYSKQHPVDIFINNAGIMHVINLQDCETEELHQEMKLNFFAPIELIHALLPTFLKQGIVTIINVSSALIYMPMPITPLYSASKAALHAYTKSLHAQLKNTSVKVIEVIPPGVDTDMTRDQKFPKMSSEKAAKVIYKGIMQNKAEIKVGFAKTLSFMSRLMPKLLFKMMTVTKV